MKIVNVNGRLETRGTWEETEAQATAQVACIAQQRAELRAMLSGNVQFHEDPHAAQVARPLSFKDREQLAFDTWLARECPSGDVEAVHSRWLASDDYLDLLETAPAATLLPLMQPDAAPATPAKTTQKPPAKTTQKPPAVWRTAAQVPQSERNGLWFCETYRGGVSFAILPRFDGSCRYLRAPEGVEFGADYDPSMYQRPDADDWFTHDPREDSICPVPAGVKFEAKCRDGDIAGQDEFDDDGSNWRLGLPEDRSPHPHDILAWRVVA